MSNLTKGLAESLKTGFLGMGITLISLYVLSLLLDFMRVIFYKPADKKKVETLPARNKEEITPQERKEEENEEDEEELVAVITAALSAYLKKPVDQIKIGFIRRIHERTPAWGMESRFNPME
jgi:sodium pump decarboxylase gamma subunit